MDNGGRCWSTITGVTRLAAARRRPALLAALVLVLVVLLGFPAFLWVGGERAVSQVTAGAGVPACTGTAPVVRRDTDGVRQQAIAMTRSFRCVVTVQVANTSSAEVDLDRLVVPVAGPGGGGSMRITSVDGHPPESGREGVDAVAVLDRTIPAGDRVSVDLVLAFRPSGCASPTTLIGLQPVVDVGHLLATQQVPVSGFPLLFGSADSSCD